MFNRLKSLFRGKQTDTTDTKTFSNSENLLNNFQEEKVEEQDTFGQKVFQIVNKTRKKVEKNLAGVLKWGAIGAGAVLACAPPVFSANQSSINSLKAKMPISREFEAKTQFSPKSLERAKTIFPNLKFVKVTQEGIAAERFFQENFRNQKGWNPDEEIDWRNAVCLDCGNDIRTIQNPKTDLKINKTYTLFPNSEIKDLFIFNLKALNFNFLSPIQTEIQELKPNLKPEGSLDQTPLSYQEEKAFNWASEQYPYFKKKLPYQEINQTNFSFETNEMFNQLGENPYSIALAYAMKESSLGNGYDGTDKARKSLAKYGNSSEFQRQVAKVVASSVGKDCDSGDFHITPNWIKAEALKRNYEVTETDFGFTYIDRNGKKQEVHNDIDKIMQEAYIKWISKGYSDKQIRQAMQTEIVDPRFNSSEEMADWVVQHYAKLRIKLFNEMGFSLKESSKLAFLGHNVGGTRLIRWAQELLNLRKQTPELELDAFIADKKGENYEEYMNKTYALATVCQHDKNPDNGGPGGGEKIKKPKSDSDDNNPPSKKKPKNVMIAQREEPKLEPLATVAKNKPMAQEFVQGKEKRRNLLLKELADIYGINLVPIEREILVDLILTPQFGLDLQRVKILMNDYLKQVNYENDSLSLSQFFAQKENNIPKETVAFVESKLKQNASLEEKREELAEIKERTPQEVPKVSKVVAETREDIETVVAGQQVNILGESPRNINYVDASLVTGIAVATGMGGLLTGKHSKTPTSDSNQQTAPIQTEEVLEGRIRSKKGLKTKKKKYSKAKLREMMQAETREKLKKEHAKQMKIVLEVLGNTKKNPLINLLEDSRRLFPDDYPVIKRLASIIPDQKRKIRRIDKKFTVGKMSNKAKVEELKKRGKMLYNVSKAEEVLPIIRKKLQATADDYDYAVAV